MKGNIYPVLIALVFLWIGFVSAISFMEAWLKFRAPGVTLEAGLSIGKLVFKALNRVEIVLAAFITICIVLLDKKLGINVFYFIPLLILLLQTFWLLPLLSSNIDLIVKGVMPRSSNVHFIFILLEALKVLSLLIFGFSLFTLLNINF